MSKVGPERERTQAERNRDVSTNLFIPLVILWHSLQNVSYSSSASKNVRVSYYNCQNPLTSISRALFAGGFWESKSKRQFFQALPHNRIAFHCKHPVQTESLARCRKGHFTTLPAASLQPDPVVEVYKQMPWQQQEEMDMQEINMFKERGFSVRRCWEPLCQNTCCLL